MFKLMEINIPVFVTRYDGFELEVDGQVVDVVFYSRYAALDYFEDNHSDTEEFTIRSRIFGRYLTAQMSKLCETCWSEDNFIESIKNLRALTGCGLREAKEIMEAYRKERNDG